MEADGGAHLRILDDNFEAAFCGRLPIYIGCFVLIETAGLA